MRPSYSTAFLVVLAMTVASPARPEQRGNARVGMTFARENCSRCHAIAKVGESPLSIAPPFRDLHNRYPVESLAEALGEGIVTGHPTMPEFRLDPDQVENFIAYLKTLEPPGKQGQ
jgi:cytochrome c